MAASTDPYPWAQPARDDDLELIIVGDVNVQKRDDPAGAFRNVRGTLAGADLRYANLEGLYGDAEIDAIGAKSHWRHSDPRMLEALVAGGFDVVGCANNVNYGASELVSTLDMLDRKGILHCGAGSHLEAAHAPAIVERKGMRLGFLQYTARYYGEEAIATADSPGVARVEPTIPAEMDRMAADVRALRPGVDLLILSHHVRDSGTSVIDPYQRELARRAVAAGADLVFGHGAHVNQGIEVVGGVAVFHCIGQFAFDWWKTRNRKDGLLLRLVASDGRIERIGFAFVHRDEANDVYLAPPQSEQGARQLREIRDMSPGVDLVVEKSEVVLRLP